MRVNLRARDLDRAGPLVVRENQSHRDLTKVGQDPAAAGLGNEAKKQVRPVRDDRNGGFWSLARGSAIASIRRSSLPHPGRIAL